MANKERILTNKNKTAKILMEVCAKNMNEKSKYLQDTEEWIKHDKNQSNPN